MSILVWQSFDSLEDVVNMWKQCITSCFSSRCFSCRVAFRHTCHHHSWRACPISHELKQQKRLGWLRVETAGFWEMVEGWAVQKEWHPRVSEGRRGGPVGRKWNIMGAGILTAFHYANPHPPTHTDAMLSQTSGPPQALISRMQKISRGSQAPAAWWLVVPLRSHTHTHTQTLP